MSPDSSGLLGYEDFIRRELPHLVRSNIEDIARRDMQPLEASLIGSLVGIIQDCQDRVFGAYREAQRVDDEIEIPPSEDNAALAQLDPAEDGMLRQSLNSYSLHSEFLDMVFEPPRTQVPETMVPISRRNRR
jgi:hypothetical protein